MKISFMTGGAAFGNEYDTEEMNYIQKGREVIRILRAIERKIEDGYEDGVIMDINGNKIGEWQM